MTKRRFNHKARHGRDNCKKTKNIPDRPIATAWDVEPTNCLENSEIEYKSVLEENPVIISDKPKEIDAKRAIDNKVKTHSTILSKKQKRKKKQIVEKKKKKLRRSDLLASLSQCQVTAKELSLYKSISAIGQKVVHNRNEDLAANVMTASDSIVPVNVARGKKKRKKMKFAKQQGLDVTVLGKDEISENDWSDSDDSDTSAVNINSTEKFHQQAALEILDHTKEEFSEIAESRPLVVNIPGNEDKVSSGNAKGLCEKAEVVSIQQTRKQQKQHPPCWKAIPASKGKEPKPAVHVQLERSNEIQAARVLLPILAEEQVIMETITENDVVIICGETGSGKTTQVPQFLYEAGFATNSPYSGMIGVTEPRRVAAVSMSKRVAFEMNLSTSIVSYQIRYEGTATNDTRLKFMTDGVLLKEMESDFLLSRYSVVIIDEAHERSVFTDILIALLSRVVPLRKKQEKPLKVIIMSATLRVDDFLDNKRLFPSPPPLLKIDSRQYPVTVHFNRKTPGNYAEEAYNKVCKIHRTLKPGGILVFLTGKNEVHSLCRRLQRTFPNRSESTLLSEDRANTSNTYTSRKRKAASSFNHSRSCTSSKTSFHSLLENEDLDEYFDDDSQYEDMMNETTDMDDTVYDAAADNTLPLHVLPLYSLLSTERQAKVFEPCPEGTRLCVIATNVAETSLTIPGIKYVVDSGKVKSRFYDKLTGVSTFRITWISKASANQRAGRAGRVEPGHCYRLYSSAVFQHDFDEFSEAEICQKPADDLFLLMKNMGIDRIRNFPFPTPPDVQALKAAEKLLLDLGALEKKRTQQGEQNTRISELGRSMAYLPICPRYGKMILLAHQRGCLQYMIIIVAALTVKEIFSDDVKLEKKAAEKMDYDEKMKKVLLTQARRKWAGTGDVSLLGDMMVILRAVGAWEFAGCTEKFCKENGLRFKAMAEIRKLRAQLIEAVNSLNADMVLSSGLKLQPPSDVQAKVMRQIFLTCLGDRVARKIPQSEIKDASLKNAYQSCSTEDPVFIHPQSALFVSLPKYVVYQEIIESSKLYMRGLTAIDEDWLPIFAAYKCTFSKPLESPPPRYDSKNGKMRCYMTSVYGPHAWVLSAMELDYPVSVDRVKWFARSLLEGKVFEVLKDFLPYLLTPPSVMVKTWSKLQPRTEVLLKDLLSEDISDKQSLLKLWKSKNEYLLDSYLQWIPESLHSKVRKKWPPIS